MRVVERARQPPAGLDRRSAETWERHLLGLAAAARSGAKHFAEPESPAEAVCGQLVRELWDLHTDGDRSYLPQPPPGRSVSSVELLHRLRAAADFLTGQSLIEASYSVGLLYTELLPADVRSARGTYYTPPALAERLLDLAAGEGVDWSSVTVLDPACGGGAFLLPSAVRMLGHHRLRGLSPQDQLAQIENHLTGIELDPFAAWMTQAFLQLLVLPQSQTARRPLSLVVVEVGDALEAVLEDHRRFDLVVGNPPFSRVSLTPQQRQAFARSLFGHANLYGIFLDAALRWRKPSGLVAFVTPTSFLGGQYFSRLRSLLLAEAPPLVIDVLSDRSGVFPSVQQETCLTVFGPNPSKTTTVHLLEPQPSGIEVTRAGSFSLCKGPLPGSPWFLPRSRRQAALAQPASRMRTRLERLGYRASTGPLVWNRFKGQIRANPEAGSYPLIWAEAVRPNHFSFDYRARLDRGFFKVEDGQTHLLTTRPCVLVQRTTAKEQPRRLVACAVPEEFLAQWGAVVVENHVNVLWAPAAGHVSPATVAAVLNTSAVDEVFRCLSGSVAVSATELHALPLPPHAIFEEVEALLARSLPPDARNKAVEELVAQAYGTPSSSRVA